MWIRSRVIAELSQNFLLAIDKSVSETSILFLLAPIHNIKTIVKQLKHRQSNS